MRIGMMVWLLCLPVSAANTVIVVTCSALCDKLVAYTQQVSDASSTKIQTDQGLQFGEPNCEPAGTKGRRCAWSHPFSEAKPGGKDTDFDWFRKRMFSSAAAVGIPKITVLADVDQYLDKRTNGSLPGDWTYSTGP